MILQNAQCSNNVCTHAWHIWLSAFICQIVYVKAALEMILIKKCDSYLAGYKERSKYKIHLVPISLRTLFM